jgi:UDP-galactopyranose mutase
MDATVVSRLPIRFDSNDLYFPDDRHQALPAAGYTTLFRAIFAHPAIAVELSVDYDRSMERLYDFCFNSMAIDEFFDYRLGELPYRSLRFHHKTVTNWDDQPYSVRNYTDAGRFTREAWWHRLPGHLHEETHRSSAPSGGWNPLVGRSVSLFRGDPGPGVVDARNR